ncbi:hypothetical protein [Microbacterium sp. NPDC057944]
MIRAVLFDLDGVVRHFDHDADLERRHGLDDGDIARAEWIARIAKESGS